MSIIIPTNGLLYNNLIYELSINSKNAYLAQLDSLRAIIDSVANGVKAPFIGAFLSNSLFIYIGKISYGIYLFHNFIIYLWVTIARFFATGVAIYCTRFKILYSYCCGKHIMFFV